MHPDEDADEALLDSSSNSGSSGDAPQGRLYSVGAAARATGIAAETLRIWERRYGQPVPIRLPSGHRRFTSDQVIWLRRVSEALARGVRASKAVGATPDELDQLLAPSAVDVDEAWLTRAFSQVEQLDQDGLELMVLEGRDDMDVVTWLRLRVSLLLERIGSEWVAGRIEVRHEHTAAEVIAHVLRREGDRFAPHTNAPTIVFATLSGEQHGLGILMASLVARQSGWRTTILGVDTPMRDLVAAAHQIHARVLGIGVSLATGGVESDRVLAELHRALGPGVKLLVGGAGARHGRRGPRGVQFVPELRELAGWLSKFEN